MHTESQRVHTEVPSGIEDLAWMAEHRIMLKEKLRKSDRKLKRTYCRVQVAGNSVS